MHDRTRTLKLLQSSAFRSNCTSSFFKTGNPPMEFNLHRCAESWAVQPNLIIDVPCKELVVEAYLFTWYCIFKAFHERDVWNEEIH